MQRGRLRGKAAHRIPHDTVRACCADDRWPTQEAALLTLRIDGIAMDHRRSAEALAAELRARGREEPPALAAVAARCTRLEDAQAAMQVSLQSGARTSVGAHGRRRLFSRRIRPLRGTKGTAVPSAHWFAAREGSALAEECAVLRDAIGRTDSAQSQLRSRREHDVEWTRVQLQGLQVTYPGRHNAADGSVSHATRVSKGRGIARLLVTHAAQLIALAIG